MSSVSLLLDRYYFSRPDFTDGTTEFHALCSRYISPQSAILEIGAGLTNRTSAHLAGLGSVTGVDISDEVLHNTSLSQAYVYNGHRLPFAQNEFDACVSNFVLEHIQNPAEHFSEISRVLRPGGTYCFRTPNLWHYITFISSLLPHSVHCLLANRLRDLADDAHEPYPTVYAANSRSAIRRHCRAAGLDIFQLSMVEKEPSYGHVSIVLFYMMMFYERLVNTSQMFDALRSNIFGVAQKPNPHRQPLL
jgi:SAM-dependent methyltransferase